MGDVVKDAGTGGQPVADVIPDNLKKYSGEGGKLDMAKLSESMSQAEKKATEEAQKRADAERAYAMALSGFGTLPDTGGLPAKGADVGAGRGSVTDDTNDVGDEPITVRDARPFTTSLLVLTHPELAVDQSGEPANPKFYEGLFKFMKGLPAPVKMALKSGDFQTVEWAVREYKALSKTRASSSAGGGTGAALPNYVEGSGPTGEQPTGKVYSRSEMRKMMRDNPDEYARISEDYGKALGENRVKE